MNKYTLNKNNLSGPRGPWSPSGSRIYGFKFKPFFTLFPALRPDGFDQLWKRMMFG